MKAVGDGANPVQGSPQQRSEVTHGPRLQSHALKISLVAARHNPGFIRHTRGIRATGNVVATHFHDPQLLVLLLLQDVAEDAALLHLIVLPRRPQLVQHPPRNKRAGYDLRRRMVKLLSRHAAEILEDADVLEASVALQVLDALAAESKILLDLAIVGVPQVAVVARIFHDDLMRSDRLHGVVQAVARAARLTIDAVERTWMYHGARRPRAAIHRRRRRYHLQLLARLRTERAEVVGRGATLGFVPADDPRAGDGILAQFHRSFTLRPRMGHWLVAARKGRRLSNGFGTLARLDPAANNRLSPLRLSER